MIHRPSQFIILYVGGSTAEVFIQGNVYLYVLIDIARMEEGQKFNPVFNELVQFTSEGDISVNENLY